MNYWKIESFLLMLFFILIFSLNCAEKKEDSNITVIDSTAPSAPSNLMAYATTGIINLNWMKSMENDVAKYRLYRSTSSILNLKNINFSNHQKPNFHENGYIEEKGTSFSDTDVEVGITYYYRVSAFDSSNNESNKSNQIIITYGDLVPPAKPLDLKAIEGLKKGEISLTWTANSESDLMGYNIYISANSKTYSYLATSTTNSYAVTDLKPGIEYFLFITAVDTASNESLYSNIVVSTAYGDIIAPAKPVGISAQSGNFAGEIYLAWTGNTETDFLAYNIYIAAQGGSDFAFLASPQENYYTIKDLSPGKGYFFKISAIDSSNNESEYSEQVFAKAKGDNTAPLAPTDLSANQGDATGKIILNWKANTETDIKKYKIYLLSTSENVFFNIDNTVGNPPDTTYIATGLVSGTTYFFKVSAVDDSKNESELSNLTGVKAP